MDVFDEMRLEDVIQEMKSIVKNTPNDMELGKLIREYVNTNLK